ncbi:MAG: serine--tRNA ligase [Candidatus Paceibacterota bacterium]
MLDIKFIRENLTLMREVAKNKRIELDFENLLAIDDKRRELLAQSETIRASQKKLGKDDIAKAKELKEQYQKLEAELKIIQAEFETQMAFVPNIYSDDTPVGKSECDNQEISKWGEPRKFDFSPLDHIALGKKLDIIDTERGTEVSGFRGYYLKNEGAMLQFALMWHALKKLQAKGFNLMFTPTILREFSLFGSGHLPQGRDNIYQIANAPDICTTGEEKEPKYMAGTSESALLAYYAGQTLEENKLPIKLAGYSQCYRSEIGSYGKDTKGLYRVHEFSKVEQIVICKADKTVAEGIFQELHKNSCELLEELGLPYRTLRICTADMGAGKYKMYDVETWMPSRQAYGETHSDSNLTDWQARRLNIKYKNQKGEKLFAYTLNNTMVASPRILIAILENHQQADGSVAVPDVLQPYLGFKVIKPKN